MVYDNAGRKTATLNALGDRTTVAYDVAGRQTLKRDVCGNRITFFDDGCGQTTERRLPTADRRQEVNLACRRDLGQHAARGQRTVDGDLQTTR